jgi:hypothetical protein
MFGLANPQIKLAMMSKKGETLKIKRLDKRWKKDVAWLNNGFKEVWRRVKRFSKKEMEGMMYGVRPKDAVDRFEHLFFWWAKLGIILFALKGIGII